MNSADDCAGDVVISVRNGAPFIKACLDSVLAQSRAPRTVVVVDDGSTDGTAAIVGSSRFGRELFSGPFDFFAALLKTRLTSLWCRLRHFAVENLKSALGPARSQALKDFIRSNPTTRRR